MEENIREPDKQTRDCLFQNYIADNVGMNSETEDDQLRRALEESELEFWQFLQHSEYVDESVGLVHSPTSASSVSTPLRLENHSIPTLRNSPKEREVRETHFAAFKMKIMQFMIIDSQNKLFYSELVKYINKYESGEIQSIQVDNDFYMKFFHTVNNMRIRQEDKSRLFELIQL